MPEEEKIKNRAESVFEETKTKKDINVQIHEL